MSTFRKLKSGKILYENLSKTIAFSYKMNILPHPTEDDMILITDDCNLQETNKGFKFDWKYVTSPLATSRNEMIEILADNMFSSKSNDESRFLDTIGDGSGTKEFNGDYSTVSAKALIKPTKDFLFVNRLIAFISDSGSVDSGMYGNNITLANGIEIKHEKQDGTLIKDITEGIAIMTNADYGRFGFNLSDVSFGSGLTYVHLVLSFNKNGAPLLLKNDEQLAVYFNDNFSRLVSHTFRAGAYS